MDKLPASLLLELPLQALRPVASFVPFGDDADEHVSCPTLRDVNVMLATEQTIAIWRRQWPPVYPKTS
jgi:hypothetical protein